MRHTPGPWAVTAVHGDICVWDVESEAGRITCDIGLAENAQLIAAAPELKEALVMLMHCGPNPRLGEWKRAIQNAGAALDKAEGR